MWLFYVLPVLYLSSVMTSPVSKPIDDAIHSRVGRSSPGRRKPEVPSLNELKLGIGTGDPTDNFRPMYKLKNGKISEQTREQLELYKMHHFSEHDGPGEGRESKMHVGQLAYIHLVKALAEDDNKTAEIHLKIASQFMAEAGLTLDDAREEARSRKDQQGSRDKRYLLRQDNAKWDKCIIPYEYSTGFTGANDVIPAMQEYEYYTGFRFVEWNSSTQALYGLSHNNRIRYVAGSGCWSYVGNLRWSGQDISCCSGSTCVHEIGHSIGFMHEQQSPIRDNYLRIEWDGIDTGYWDQYERSSPEDSVLFGYYDPTSVMHYWNGGFGVNYKDTFTTMDPDRDFLIDRDTRYFYLFKEAMESHNCWDVFCNAELTCENGGYPSVVQSACTCVCPDGLDPDTRCVTKLAQDTSNALQWPDGSFTTLKTVDGCPAGFESGWQYHKPADYIWGSDAYHASPTWTWWDAEHEFCSRIATGNEGTDWPAGSYCIYRKGGSCPSGFESGYIQMDDAPTSRTNTTAGELPDGVYGANTRWEFCCRSDGAVSQPIKLPTQTPFILFEQSYCQEVEGMKVSSEYFSWRSDTADNYVEYGGSLPYTYRFSNELFNLYFCYYASIDTDCGELYELDSSQPTLNIQSPNYPNAYGANQQCTYTVLAQEQSTLQVDFDAFDVDCADESLQIGFSMPGHPGKSFCGDGFKETIITSENYLRLKLNTGSSPQGGFSAIVKLLDDSNKCHTDGDGDRSYSGDVSYTKNHETCLPWNEVQNCRFHRFAPETFDDDLTENHCRNTGLGTGPWCYTNGETCARDYCDACGTRNCFDLFDDCAQLIAADSNFCSTNLDGQALRGCRLSCNQCQQEIATPVTCSTPGNVENITPSPIKDSYSVGETVEYVCPLDGEKDRRQRTCTSSGDWTDLGFVCGACLDGWGSVDGLCYKWIDERVPREDAQGHCESFGASLATINSQIQIDYISKIVYHDVEEKVDVWIGLKKANDGQYNYWDDGSSATFTNWDSGEPYTWYDCVAMKKNKKWETVSCSNSRPLVCSHTPSERRVCADQSSKCEAYIRATPDLCVRQTDFAEANCPYSCGICSNNQITIQDDEDAGEEGETIGKRNLVKRDCFLNPVTPPSTTTTTTDSTTTTTTETDSTTTTTSTGTTTTPTDPGCSDPGLPGNAELLTDGGDITVGQIYEYSCNSDYVLSSGNLIRACLVTDQLTGSEPICSLETSVETPVNDVDIRRRPNNGNAFWIYTADNQEFRITKNGKITKWRFYSMQSGAVSLQVWRFNGLSGTLIGQNMITDTGEDRIRTIEIPESDQISVQDGDFIAVQAPGSDNAVIPYTRCQTSYEPTQGNVRYAVVTDLSGLVEGNSFDFTWSSTDWECRTWSLNAFVK